MLTFRCTDIEISIKNPGREIELAENDVTKLLRSILGTPIWKSLVKVKDNENGQHLSDRI